MALRWGRETREEKVSGKPTAIKPPPESLAVNLENLKTIFLVTYGTLYRKQEGDSEAEFKPQMIPPSHCTGMASGIESDIFILDPED